MLNINQQSFQILHLQFDRNMWLGKGNTFPFTATGHYCGQIEISLISIYSKGDQWEIPGNLRNMPHYTQSYFYNSYLAINPERYVFM